MSRAIHRHLAAFALVIAAATAGGGCCCCNCDAPEVPVDCEDWCAFLKYHGSDCCNYPYSCPRCPYYDYNCFWRPPYFARPIQDADSPPGNSRGIPEIVPPDDAQSRQILE